MKARFVLIGAVSVLLACVSSLQATVNIATVPVGNAGNTGEQSRLAMYGDETYYGGVDYEYNIGKYEVTAGQYAEFLNAVAATDTYGLYNTFMNGGHPEGCQITRNGSSGSYTYDFSNRPSGTEADWVNRPVNYVSWGDAARFANWLHNGQPTGAQDLTTTEDGAYYLNGATGNGALQVITRQSDWKWAIPSDDEWYKAAYHKNDGVTGNYFLYPTSTDSFPSQDLIDPDPGNNATFRFPSPSYTIGSPYYRTEVGAHENSESPYGTFDQAGNVAEWNEVIYTHYRGQRGGSYKSDDMPLLGLAPGGGVPEGEGRFTGFRVVQVPEPTAMIVLSIGGLALLRRRR